MVKSPPNSSTRHRYSPYTPKPYKLQPTSRLLALPGELRNKILAHTLGHNTLHLIPPTSPHNNLHDTGVIIKQQIPSLIPSTTSATPTTNERTNERTTPKNDPETSSTPPLYPPPTPYPTVLPILSTCRQLHAEAHFFPLTHNIFEIQDLNHFSAWSARALDARQQGALREVRVESMEAYFAGKINAKVSSDFGDGDEDDEDDEGEGEGGGEIHKTLAAPYGSLKHLRNLHKVVLTGSSGVQSLLQVGNELPAGWREVCRQGVRKSVGKRRRDLLVVFEEEEEE